ncbi:MAG: response regulator transcription factor [Bacteroidota bacterium]
MKKTIFLYGAGMAALIILLKTIEYNYLIRQLNIEIYLGIIAALFTVLGIWVGIQLIKRREKLQAATSYKPTSSSENNSPAPDISEREMDVLLLMAEGLSNQEIADKLFISIHTVKTHSSNLFSKLQVKRRTQAIQKSKEIGLIG